MSPPMRGRGLKPFFLVAVVIVVSVAPHAGARIETRRIKSVRSEGSRPCRQFLGKMRRIGYRNRIMSDAT